jgi:hypothetical protein
MDIELESVTCLQGNLQFLYIVIMESEGAPTYAHHPGESPCPITMTLLLMFPPIRI